MSALTRRWAALTRDSRDTLFLLLVLAWTLLPQAGRVPAWCTAFTLGALLWRARLAWLSRPLPKRWWLVIGLLAATSATLWSHHTLVGKQAGLTLLMALTALKTLELHARRDAVVVFFLGFFAVLANFLYSQSLAVAIAMVLSVLGLLTALALAHMPAGMPPLRRAAGLAVRHAAIGTPLVVLLFLFFPRLPPLWGMPTDAGGRTGLSDEMTLGQVAELASDDAVAMRVRFTGPMPAQRELYFRGPVLRLYDGRQWRADDGGISPSPDGSPPAALPLALALDRPVSYEATIEPLRVSTLPLLEFTAQLQDLPGDLRLAFRNDLVWHTHRPVNDRWRLRATAYLDLRYLPQGPQPVSELDTRLPVGAHLRTRAWAQALRQRVSASPQAPQPWVDAVLQHIGTAGFSYTLAPGTTPGDAVDSFWLDRREGFCEHFSSAFVVVMRALGVPARIVTGYQGGTVNPLDGLLEVRQSDAHAWAEVWLPERGWTRIDPTAAVAPDRIQQSTRLRAPGGLVGGALAQISPNLLQQWRQTWSALDNRWNQWVLNYSRNRQFELLSSLGWESPDLMALARVSLWVLGGLGLLGALWAAWDARRGQREVDPWLRAQQQLQRTLARRGLALPAHCPPAQLAEAVLATWPEQGQPLARLLQALSTQRYGKHPADSITPGRWQRSALRASKGLTPVRRIRPLAGA